VVPNEAPDLSPGASRALRGEARGEGRAGGGYSPLLYSMLTRMVVPLYRAVVALSGKGVSSDVGCAMFASKSRPAAETRACNVTMSPPLPGVTSKPAEGVPGPTSLTVR
jgi:hypothetical protein